MFRISDFSRLTRVSVKTLRHYDRLGLLEPAFVDPRTGYRHYAARQVRDLQRILALKDQGFALEHIRELIAGGVRGTALVSLLHTKRIELEQQLERDRQRLDVLVARLREIEGGTHAKIPEVALSALPPVRVASRRARVASLDDGIAELFEALEGEVGDVRGAGPPLVIYHDRDHRERDADVEVAVPVLTSAARVGRASVRALPAVPRAACVVYAGSYDQWTALARGLIGWLQTRRLAPAGPMREVFLQFGATNGTRIPDAYLVEREGDFLTEMQIPVRRASSR